MKALLGPVVLRRLKTEVAGQLTTKSHATGGGQGKPRWGQQLALRAALPRACLAHQPRIPGAACNTGLLLTAVVPPRTPRAAAEFIEMTDVQSSLYSASVAKMRSQITGKAAAAAADRSNKGVEKFLRTLGAKKISHMFTHLRKIAQHPLLVRSNYSDDQVALIARAAHDRCAAARPPGGSWRGGQRAS